METKIFKKEEKNFSTEKKWKFCNVKLQPYPNTWSDSYRCPCCGSKSGLVNVLGGCSTKVFL